MTRRTNYVFIDEIHAKPPIKINSNNKNDGYNFFDIWSVDILDIQNYGPESNVGYRYVLVVIDNFSKFGWATPLKNKNAQLLKESFEIFFKTSKKTKFKLK